jgi:hypothetical protein
LPVGFAKNPRTPKNVFGGCCVGGILKVSSFAGSTHAVPTFSISYASRQSYQLNLMVAAMAFRDSENTIRNGKNFSLPKASRLCVFGTINCMGN